MKYIYCLVRDIGTGLEALPSGLDGAKVHHIPFRGVDALISNLEPVHLVSSVQSALVHQEVVAASSKLFKSVIPCRFGTLFSDDESIVAFLKEHYSRLDSQLTRLEGKIEVGIQAIFNARVHTVARRPLGEDGKKTRVQGDRGEAPKKLGQRVLALTLPGTDVPKAGTNYLLKKKEKFDAIKELEEEAERFGQELNRALSPLWSEVKTQQRTIERKLLHSICYLVEKRKLFAFRGAYQRFKSEKPCLRLLYTGPWPPYSFANMDFRTDKE